MKLIQVAADNIDLVAIKKASDIIRSGGLVIFPTETVYGIGVDVFNPEAVKKVFELKGRKFSNPLTLHLADKEDIKKVVKEVSSIAKNIIDKFLPGPITVILKKNEKIPDVITAGRNTVGIRIPDHKVAYRFISETETFIAATSANFSGDSSPGSVNEIPGEILEQADLIIDSGQTKFGVHSTVVDFSASPPRILREGSFSKEELIKILALPRKH